jgi:uncharacterized protein YgbK (DUF1537 family)
MVAKGGEWVAVGSGALARPVAALDARTPPATSAGAVRSRPAGPVLLLCGSAHAGNRAQAAALAHASGVPVVELRLSDPTVAIAAAMAGLRTAGGASLVVEASRHDSAVVLRALVAAAVEILAATGTNRIFATGGETAFALCRQLGIAALEFGEEIEPGLVLSRAVADCGPLQIAIKPGGFGTAEAWVRAWERLRA